MKRENKMNFEKNLKKLIIEKKSNYYEVQKFYENPVYDEDEDKSYDAIAFNMHDIDELIAMIIDNPLTADWERLRKNVMLMCASWLDIGWQFIDDFMKEKKISRARVYQMIDEGKLQKFKLGKYVLVKPIEQ